MFEFKDGTKLKGLVWKDRAEILEADGAQIEVVMVAGEMAYVPWAKVTYPDGSKAMWNLAHVSGVLLKD